MRVQPAPYGPLTALGAVLKSVESVRNAPALYLLLLSLALAGLLLTQAQGALAHAAPGLAALPVVGAVLIVFYGSNAAGLAVMDEAQGRTPRHPLDALQDALRLAHRLAGVALVALLCAAAVVALLLALLWATRLPWIGASLLSLVVALGVPLMGGVALVMVTLVGPIAAPAVWSGLTLRQTLAMVLRQMRRRFAHAVLLSAAVSLLSAAVAGLVSFVVLTGGRALLGLVALATDIELPPDALMAALFGIGLRVPVGAPPLSPALSAALSGAGVVFALGLVLPGVVYLRGLCALFLELQAIDRAWDGEPEPAETSAKPAVGTSAETPAP